MPSQTSQVLIDTWSERILEGWRQFGKLQGDLPSERERTMAHVAAEVVWAEVVVAQIAKGGIR